MRQSKSTKIKFEIKFVLTRISLGKYDTNVNRSTVWKLPESAFQKIKLYLEDCMTKKIQHVKHYHYNLLFDYVYALSLSYKLMTYCF